MKAGKQEKGIGRRSTVLKDPDVSKFYSGNLNLILQIMAILLLNSSMWLNSSAGIRTAVPGSWIQCFSNCTTVTYSGMSIILLFVKRTEHFNLKTRCFCLFTVELSCWQINSAIFSLHLTVLTYFSLEKERPCFLELFMFRLLTYIFSFVVKFSQKTIYLSMNS